MDIKVYIPTHNTSLSQPPSPFSHPNRFETTTNNNNEDIYIAKHTDVKTHAFIQLFVDRERALWNFFKPIFSSNQNARIQETLMLVLLRNLKPTLKISHLTASINKVEDVCENDHVDDTTDQSLPLPWTECNFNAKLIESRNHRRKLLLFIYIIPPLSPFISRKYAMQPERTFSSSLVRLENLQIQLQSMNGYIATLGGGYFLCHYLGTAVCLARYQRRIALQLNDVELAMKCTINEAYNYIYAGNIRKALSLIEETKELAKTRIQNRSTFTKDDEEKDVIVSMCNAAKWFAKQVRNEMKRSRKRQRNGGNDIIVDDTTDEKHISTTHDDLQRIRVVHIKSISNSAKMF